MAHEPIDTIKDMQDTIKLQEFINKQLTTWLEVEAQKAAIYPARVAYNATLNKLKELQDDNIKEPS